MININISDTGEINISHETPGERVIPLQEYERESRPVGPDGDPLGDEERDEEPVRSIEPYRGAPTEDDLKGAFFKSGWQAAVREAQLHYVSGAIEQFWQEQSPQLPPEGEQPFLYNMEFDKSELAPAPASALNDIHPVSDSGEPELEKAQDISWTSGDPGTWTMSNEELNSRLDETYNRGFNTGKLSAANEKSVTSFATLNIMAGEIVDDLFHTGFPVASTKHEIAVAIAIPLAKRLGWGVES